jgi:hypothetical protein
MLRSGSVMRGDFAEAMIVRFKKSPTGRIFQKNV